MRKSVITTFVYTALAMVAFAANSILCRAALGQSLIDAPSFTLIRILSGAVTLGLIWRCTRLRREALAVDWISAAMLFLYAILFSFAYLLLKAGTGALILFGFVQLTMISAGLAQGHRPTLLAWTGLLVAASGLVYLVSPGLSAPPLQGAILMAGAGIGWGLYSLRGRRAQNPILATAANFIAAVPMALAVGAAFIGQMQLNAMGALLAVLSGAFASGLGYVVWYTALPGLNPTKAASVQLSVPAIASLAGTLFLAEPLTLRLVLATAMVLGGIAVVLSQR